MPKIAIIGAGVAGLTVAHECVERGCDVVVFEKDYLVGGKAASDYYRGKPRDHAPKNISPYYYCLIEQLKRIPINDTQTVYDNLFAVKHTVIQFQNQSITLSSSLAISKRLCRAYKSYRFFRRFVSRRDIFKLIKQLIRFLFMTDPQRKKLDQISYAELLQLDAAHPLIKISETVGAIDPNNSALMCLDQFSRQLLAIFNPHHLHYMTNFFCKPTTDSFFSPWKSHLQSLGVSFITNQEITQLCYDNNKITKIKSHNQEFTDFDAYVVAMDIPGIEKLNIVTPLKPELRSIHHCAKKACGFFIALSALPQHLATDRYYISVDHPWSMFYIGLTRQQFTDDIYFTEGCSAYLWFTFSQTDTNAIFINKNVANASAEEVLAEITQYLQFSPADKNNILTFYWGRSVLLEASSDCHRLPVIFNSPVNPQPISNTTSYSNLFLAGEFTDTLQKSPTMEKANESGKRCAKLILDSFNIEYPVTKFQYRYLPFQSK